MLQTEARSTKKKTIIESRRGLFQLDFNGLWQYRELLFFLVWRDIKVRYKQAFIGIGWAVMQPVATMLVFTIVFGHFARIPSDGIPYPLFAFTALLPWTYFSQALARSGGSLVGDAHLISKVYFPRLIIPIATAITPFFDFIFSFLTLIFLMFWFGIVPHWGLLSLPLFLMLAFGTSLSLSLWLSPLHVRFRDVGHALPLLIQLWMYACPVVYPVSVVPEKWRMMYSMNPMTGVVEGFRWAMLGSKSPDLLVIMMSSIAVLVLLMSGMVFFKRQERSFADII
jgi:lipopolysaccharide transport system permease protein